MPVTYDFVTVDVAGVTVTTGAASLQTAMPVTTNGVLPKHIRVQTTGYAFIKFGPAPLTCTTNDMLLSPNDFYVFNVADYPVFSVIQNTAPALVNIIPIES